MGNDYWRTRWILKWSGNVNPMRKDVNWEGNVCLIFHLIRQNSCLNEKMHGQMIFYMWYDDDEYMHIMEKRECTAITQCGRSNLRCLLQFFFSKFNTIHSSMTVVYMIRSNTYICKARTKNKRFYFKSFCIKQAEGKF